MRLIEGATPPPTNWCKFSLILKFLGLTMGLKALGIASWGYIANKETLINKKDSEMNRAQYNSNLEIKSGSKPPLSPDYTHFLLVDDGYRNRLANKN